MYDVETTKGIEELRAAANTGNASEVLRVLNKLNTSGVTIPIEELTSNLIPKMNMSLPDSVVTMPYSGVLGAPGSSPIDREGRLRSWHIAESLGENSGGKVATIGQTEAFELLQSPVYDDALRLSTNKAGLKFQDVMGQQWHTASGLFIKANPNPQISITPFSLDTAVYAKTELPTSWNHTLTPSYESLERGTFLPIAPANGDTTPIRQTMSVISGSKAGEIAYGFDGANTLHLDTHNFWGDAYPEIPRQSLPTDVLSSRPIAEVAVTAPAPEQAKAIAQGMQGLDTMAQHSDEAAKVAKNIHGLKWLSEVAEQGKKGIILSIVTTGLGVALTREAIAAQRDLADKAVQFPEDHPDHMTKAQYEDYKALIDDAEPLMIGQASDPFFVTSTATTFALERDLYKKFTAFTGRHPTLSPTLADALQPGLVPVKTITQELKDATIETLEASGNNINALPPSMRKLGSAILELNLAEQQYKRAIFENTPPPMSIFDVPEILAMQSSAVQNANKAYATAAQNLDSSFRDALQSYDGVSFMVAQMENDDLRTAVEAITKFENPSKIPTTPDAMRALLVDKIVPAANRPQDAFDMSPETKTRIESTSDYITIATVMDNRRAGIESDPVQISEMRGILRQAYQNPQSSHYNHIVALAEQNFPVQMGQEQQKLAEEREQIRMFEAWFAQQKANIVPAIMDLGAPIAPILKYAQ